MPGRVVAQWDKDDCEDLGIIKVDLLGLGMMAVLQETLELWHNAVGPRSGPLPEEDPETFELIRRADTIGVFQIESRAQMATLPRMKPKFFRLGDRGRDHSARSHPGRLVHPYLAPSQRQGAGHLLRDERLKPILERTLGIPLFQEQMLEMAMVMADFSGYEAEDLRRAMSFIAPTNECANQREATRSHGAEKPFRKN